ncbi:AI-2E family transporter [Bordetella petrii]|uniref:AI-2E family transporter n=1 Tax=Bordetella petrii TaxID=94624 RepID=UPI001E38146A|nr:AI-2E family transporter [Bordetella petrii]MCD0504491.1 AI-2E family transporter [Bordetella petrii]
MMSRQPDSTPTVLFVICAILVLGLMYLASPVFVPLAFALFMLALVAPARAWLNRRMPAWLAALATLLLTAAGAAVFLSLAGWGFGLIAQWMLGNANRFQRLFSLETENLHPHGALLVRMFLDSFNVSWLVRLVQEVALRINSMLGLAFLTIIFIALGLFELDEAPARLEKLLGPQRSRDWLRGAAQIAAKLRRYMWIRTIASVLTGLTVWLFAMYAGLELATAWGGLAFLLNYIPFLGPFVATVFPALFAFGQYESLQASLAVFLVLNFIQIAYGCYLEPRLAGNALSLSPLMVMLAVFFWGFVWGIPGTFIGVPLLIACTTAFSISFNRTGAVRHETD